MQINYVVIRFTSPFHVGRSGLSDSYDRIPSFTIYGALEWLRKMGAAVDVERVSSAIPLIKWAGCTLRAGGYCLSAPAPANLVLRVLRRAQGGNPVEVVKSLKGLRYIPWECLGDELVVDRGAVKCRGEEIRYISPRPVVVVKNVLSRHLQNSDVYRIAAYLPQTPYVIYFQGGGKAFEVLGRIGLGGERSSGLGKFEIVDRGSLQVRDSGKNALLLGFGRVEKPRGWLNVDYAAWNCTHALIGATAVLAEGTVLEAESLDFVDINLDSCAIKLTPLYIWLN